MCAAVGGDAAAACRARVPTGAAPAFVRRATKNLRTNGLQMVSREMSYTIRATGIPELDDIRGAAARGAERGSRPVLSSREVRAHFFGCYGRRKCGPQGTM